MTTDITAVISTDAGVTVIDMTIAAATIVVISAGIGVVRTMTMVMAIETTIDEITTAVINIMAGTMIATGTTGQSAELVM